MSRFAFLKLLSRRLFIAGLLAVGAAPVLAAAPVAIVTDATADAPASLLQEMEAGQVIELQTGQALTMVFYADNQEYRFTGPTVFRLEASKPIILSGNKSAHRDLKALESTGLKPGVHRLDQAAVAFRYVYTDEKKIEGLQPNNTRVLSTSPTFGWLEVSDAQQHKYRFKLVSTYGQVVYTVEVNHPEVTLPEEVVLTPGTLYNWHVDTGAGEMDRVGRASFTVAGADQAAALLAAEPTDDASFSEHLVYTLLLEGNGFEQAAQQRWRALAEQRPGDTVLAEKAHLDTAE